MITYNSVKEGTRNRWLHDSVKEGIRNRWLHTDSVKEGKKQMITYPIV